MSFPRCPQSSLLLRQRLSSINSAIPLPYDLDTPADETPLPGVTPDREPTISSPTGSVAPSLGMDNVVFPVSRHVEELNEGTRGWEVGNRTSSRRCASACVGGVENAVLSGHNNVAIDLFR